MHSVADQSGVAEEVIPETHKYLKRSFLPLREMLRKHVFRRGSKALESIADKTWDIAPGNYLVTRPAYYLPNQLERVTDWEFANEHPRKRMEGNINDWQSPVRAYLIKDAFLIDGVLYKGDASLHLNPRTRHLSPQLTVENEIDRGAVYCTFAGNKYFGNWLMDDCLAYPLAAAEGVPVSTDQPLAKHILPYEKLLEMNPVRLKSAFFKELIIFDDLGNNLNRAERFQAMRDKLLLNNSASMHPGVFILRGSTGEKRILKNELEIAEHLRDAHGYKIIQPAGMDVNSIIKACAGAQVVVGVEGSQLIHGIQLLPKGGSILTLQPPNRFVHAHKAKSDRDGQHFGFVVGVAEGEDFQISIDEVERTLDLFPKL